MQKKQLVVRAVEFQLIIGKLYKMGLDEIFLQYFLSYEKERVSEDVHSGITGGNYHRRTTAREILIVLLW